MLSVQAVNVNNNIYLLRFCWTTLWGHLFPVFCASVDTAHRLKGQDGFIIACALFCCLHITIPILFDFILNLPVICLCVAVTYVAVLHSVNYHLNFVCSLTSDHLLLLAKWAQKIKSEVNQILVVKDN